MRREWIAGFLIAMALLAGSVALAYGVVTFGTGNNPEVQA